MLLLVYNAVYRPPTSRVVGSSRWVTKRSGKSNADDLDERYDGDVDIDQRYADDEVEDRYDDSDSSERF